MKATHAGRARKGTLGCVCFSGIDIIDIIYSKRADIEV